MLVTSCKKVFYNPELKISRLWRQSNRCSKQMFTTRQQSVRLAACGWMNFFVNAPNLDSFSRKWVYSFNTAKKKKKKKYKQTFTLPLTPNSFCSSLAHISCIPQLGLLGEYISDTWTVWIESSVSVYLVRLQEGLHQVVPSESSPQDSHG